MSCGPSCGCSCLAIRPDTPRYSTWKGSQEALSKSDLSSEAVDGVAVPGSFLAVQNVKQVAKLARGSSTALADLPRLLLLSHGRENWSGLVSETLLPLSNTVRHGRESWSGLVRNTVVSSSQQHINRVLYAGWRPRRSTCGGGRGVCQASTARARRLGASRGRARTFLRKENVVRHSKESHKEATHRAW